METPRDIYSSPFVTRWAGRPMQENWSDLTKYRTWRRLWIALAEAQRELGLEITDEQIRELKAHADEIDFERVAEHERETRHEVTAHIRTYGELCPKARPIIHLGATSAFVGDNTYLVQMRGGLHLLLGPVSRACRNLVELAREHAETPCLAYTHLQPAQVTTLGKRACLWLHDLLGALEGLRSLAEDMPFRSAKGTTGTQASFLSLFDGDHDKVRRLEELVARKMGFSRVVPVTGQTYPRMLDYRVLTTLGELAIACSKLGTDLRLLAGFKEMEEPFGKSQVGSSAMAYKRNPMRCERMVALSRFLINDVQNAAFTAADQWLERTLDDSAIRRLSLAEGFLAADSIARVAANVTAGLVVNGQVIDRRLRAELPFMATETILMAAVQAGGDRQDLHERIRQHSVAAAERVKQGDGHNDLIERIREDQEFAAVRDELDALVEPAAFVGRAPQQAVQYLEQVAEPTLSHYPEEAGEEHLRV
ncbi:MAG: adenylosuccinate lyase [Candidatus Brocadiia bacterium]